MPKSVSVVGAGLSGAVIAHELANAGHHIDVFDSRDHLAGNCHSERDAQTNVMVHMYGPHIFHTSKQKIWKYIQQFDTFKPFVNRVKAIANGRVYSLPINLLTINQFFEKTLSPSEAQEFIKSIGDGSITDPKNFEEQSLKFIGEDLYEAFFKGYSEKHWGIHPSELPASIIKRLPVRFNYDDNYFSDIYQGIPENGYTHIARKMLNHKNISVYLEKIFVRNMKNEYDHTFYSGPIDEWFGFNEGRLAYRTLDFKIERHNGDYQGNAVINYCDREVPHTRITEHKHFAPWEKHEKTFIYKEYSRKCENCDIPYYPIRLINDKEQLFRYVDLANAEKKTTFVGRLGTYRYLDMDVTINEALDAAELFIKVQENGQKMPSFVVNPIL